MNCTVAERLLDTNVLVYAYDASEKRRREIAKELLNEVWDDGGGVVTLQNLSEFFFAVPVRFRGRFQLWRPRQLSRTYCVLLDGW
jgi:predicted nucleic acid-binding protein